MASETIYVPIEKVSVPSAARTATGSAAGVLTGTGHTMRAFLDVTAASGTAPTLDVKLETSHDGVTWRLVKAFAQKTGVSSERISTSDLDKHVRWAWTITGTTPSFTFSVAGDLVS